MAKKTSASRPSSAADATTGKPRRSRAAAAPKARPRRAGADTPAKPPIEGPDAGEKETLGEAVVVPPGRLEATADVIGRTLGRTAAMVADHLPWTRGSDGLDLLERDHRRIEALLKQGIETPAESLADRAAILKRIARDVAVHEQLEEQVLYPVLKSHAEAKDIVLEGYQEHHVADLLLKELQELPPSDERWGAKLKVLQESLEHHIGEEEGEMFKTARSVLSREQLEEIGARMDAMRLELQGEAPSSSPM